MTNYMGISRLKKIFFGYISARPKLKKEILSNIKKFGKESLFGYSKCRGSEWLKYNDAEYKFEIYASNSYANNKVVIINEWKDEVHLDIIMTHYDENFKPIMHIFLPREVGVRKEKCLFLGEEIEASSYKYCLCYDIAKVS